ncbi:MAG: hypothetical protein WCG27_11620, partial [Pseudomonadota bacterium]
LQSMGSVYLKSADIKLVSMDDKDTKYLNSIYQRVIKENELLFGPMAYPKFYIIKDAAPFFFSLPGEQYFFSLGLFTKYLKHEELLVSVLVGEMIKSHRNLYRKNIIIPVGYYNTEKMLYLTRLPLDVRVEVNKWAFYSMKRAGHDAMAYLNWLQTQNKNTLDFLLQFGDPQSISKEEFLFKNFIIAENGQFRNNIRKEVNSSGPFYKLINDLKKVGIDI